MGKKTQNLKALYKITCSPQVQNTYDTTHLKKQYGEIQIDHPNIIIKHEIKKIYFKKFFNFNIEFGFKLTFFFELDVISSAFFQQIFKHLVAQSEPKADFKLLCLVYRDESQ